MFARPADARGSHDPAHSAPAHPAANAYIGFDATGACGLSRAWNTAAVQWWGYWSHYDCRSRRSSWPLPEVEDADALARHARERDILTIAPVEGDIFLQYSARQQRFFRASVVTQVVDRRLSQTIGWYFDIVAIEGDIAARGLFRGAVRQVRRRAMAARGDRFARWTELAAAQRIGCPAPIARPFSCEVPKSFGRAA